jgi:hypothetical protein
MQAVETRPIEHVTLPENMHPLASTLVDAYIHLGNAEYVLRSMQQQYERAMTEHLASISYREATLSRDLARLRLQVANRIREQASSNGTRLTDKALTDAIASDEGVQRLEDEVIEAHNAVKMAKATMSDEVAERLAAVNEAHIALTRATANVKGLEAEIALTTGSR